MTTRNGILAALAVIGVFALATGSGDAQQAKVAPAPNAAPPDIGPLPRLDRVDPRLAELGKLLFFDERLSGDVEMSCATCHDPAKGWGDGQPLGKAYIGSEYFRNTKSLLNSVYASYFMWDGRLSGKDVPTMMREMIVETHFLNMDGRLMLERLKQVPDYVRRFNQTLGGEPSFGRTLEALAAFTHTIVSKNVPFDRGAMSAEAKRGMDLFKGKAGCVQCHNGSFFSDSKPHRTGVPENPAIRDEPLRHITFRSYFKFMGVPKFEKLETDVGYFAVSKTTGDEGKFVTPTLRELKYTAPYMHNGMLATLDEVIAFYDAGGGSVADKSPLLKKLGLSDSEKADLAAFLEALSGAEVVVKKPEIPKYQVQKNWRTTRN